MLEEETKGDPDQEVAEGVLLSRLLIMQVLVKLNLEAGAGTDLVMDEDPKEVKEVVLKEAGKEV